MRKLPTKMVMVYESVCSRKTFCRIHNLPTIYKQSREMAEMLPEREAGTTIFTKNVAPACGVDGYAPLLGVCLRGGANGLLPVTPLITSEANTLRSVTCLPLPASPRRDWQSAYVASPALSRVLYVSGKPFPFANHL
jgi:hypothetical protein